MSTTNDVPKLGNMPMELQQMIWTEAILADYTDRVIPVLYGSNQIVLRNDTMVLPEFFRYSQASRSAAQRIYDLQLPVMKNGKPGYVRLSSKLDIFFVSAWGYTLGVNVRSPLFQVSPTPLRPEALAKVERVMEHHLDLEDLVYNVDPTFDRAVFPSVNTCFIRLDHERPTLANLAGRLPGPGPHTAVDLLDYCTKPSWYEEREVTDVTEDEEMEDAEVEDAEVEDAEVEEME
ncbi:hypothetical protein PG993_003903 [Apiospora rasikravindrae]|uniref:2EXR domain-containing protein n=1 Tax=Apiospora rasikravindrae TaxID=990691 RepID=A0ABR1U3I9_9PEZI